MVAEGIISEREAVARIEPAQVDQLLRDQFDPGAKAKAERIARGLNASPGAASGAIVLDADTAEERGRAGEDVILVRWETTPDDIHGLIHARGVLTSHGGMTSHAAVVARGMGKPCVAGCETLSIEHAAGIVRIGDHVLHEGDLLTIDGGAGTVMIGAVPLVPPAIDRNFGTVLEWADDIRRLRVRANADTPEDASRARRFGAQGIGLCRTEHMFLGDRRELVEHLIVAETEEEQERALSALLPLQRQDFIEILESMDGLPVTIRLIDPPLHEFLPDYTELSVQVAMEDDHHKSDGKHHKLLDAVKRLHEQNPMLGLRGVRLGIVIPGLFSMQARAILEAAAERKKAGGDPRPEIMIPLVATVQELELVKADIISVASKVEDETGADLDFKVGTMIELPRAVMAAGEIAEAAEFFSFGTNDLTQMTWGFSRDDVEASFFGVYLDKGIFGVSPFETLDRDGVGALVRHAVEKGRASRPDLHLGVCGEHGGDPASIHFFDDVGLDYVSCSPFRVPVARLEAGRSNVSDQSDTA
jgi:pyruvate,orthophosphate dikinase